MGIVCLDTHILIWGFKGQATPNREMMIDRAKRFLKWLDDNRTRVIIPSVVIGELLMPVPPDEHERINTILEKNFIIAPFDTASASCFAKIWQSKKDDDTIQKLRDNYELKREEIKVDCQIVATAVVRKAICIYSYDPGVKEFGKGYIDVREMPIINDQLELL